MIFTFYKTSHDKIIDLFFDHYAKQANIHDNFKVKSSVESEGWISLPAFSYENLSKIVQFCKDAFYHSNHLEISINNDQTENSHRMIDISKDVDYIILNLSSFKLNFEESLSYYYPIYAVNDDLKAYFSNDCLDTLKINSSETYTPYVANYFIISSIDTENYLYTQYLRDIVPFFSLEQIADHTFKYSYSTLLPDFKEKSDFFRILLYKLSEKKGYSTLKKIKKNHSIKMDLNQDKISIFSVLEFSGYLDVINKKFNIIF